MRAVGVDSLGGEFTPTFYRPLCFTFLLRVMVIGGGSGCSVGAIRGRFLIRFLSIEAEPIGIWRIGVFTSGIAEDGPIRRRLIEHAARMRLMSMERPPRFAPGGLNPERRR